MLYFSIPTCYFPSTVLFIDDNRDFLLNFVLQLDEGLAYRVFDSPFNAIDCIQKKYNDENLLSQRCLKRFSAMKPEFLNSQYSPFNLSSLQNEIYNARRFDDIAVIVVDYAMPNINGLDFCCRIDNTTIKKILLIDEADETLAISALKQGLIDRYFHKNDPDAGDLITQAIEALEWQYFQEMSDKTTRLLAIEPPPILRDKEFGIFFREFCREKGIVEFYLADNSGSFLLLDEDAKASLFVIKNENDAYHYYNLTPQEWLECSGSHYFYAHLEGEGVLDVCQDELVSYHTHLQEIDVEELLLL